ncbi:hypothetical protein Tco_0302596 [Tanacetum coccineum]
MSKKQDCTAMSSAEAEYVVLSASCAQVMRTRTQLKDYSFNYNKIPLYCDSQSAIAILYNPVQTEYQLADMFTKALPEDRFQHLVRRISYALSWKPYQGDYLNLPDHRLILAESDSLSHAHAQITKTYYKHRDSKIKKAQELKTKTFAYSDIKDNSLETKLQGRLLESFQEDAKYENVVQDPRSPKIQELNDRAISTSPRKQYSRCYLKNSKTTHYGRLLASNMSMNMEAQNLQDTSIRKPYFEEILRDRNWKLRIEHSALYGRKCRSPVLWAEIGESSLPGLELVQETTDKVVLIKEKLKAARDHQKSYADKRRKPLEVEVGDRILERIGLVAYRLRLPEELSSVHDTFYVSNLKKCLADANLHVRLNEIKVDKTLHFVEEPVEIMDREIKKLKRRKIALVKVRWNSKRDPEFTWEHEDHIRIKYPQLFLDRVVEPAS